MPILMLIIIILSCFIERFISIEIKSFLYSTSLTVKSIIIFFLPFLIFCLLFKASVKLAKDSTKIILLLVIAICCSNFITTMLGRYVGIWVYSFDINFLSSKRAVSDIITPLWNFHLPPLISNNYAMVGAIISGIFFSLFKKEKVDYISNIFDQIINKILFVISYLVPLFIAGFILKLKADGTIDLMIKDYLKIALLVAFAQFAYIFTLYFVANNFNIDLFYKAIKNMLPAGFSGFSTMSSAASIPLTIKGTEQNTKNPYLTNYVIPITVNVHLIGDCLAIPIFAFAILKQYGVAAPDLWSYMIFVSYFVIAKFSVAAVPGGGIIVMLPILQNCLGLTSEMLSIITTLYILFDPIITAANVMGNGAFAIIINKLNINEKNKIRH